MTKLMTMLIKRNFQPAAIRMLLGGWFLFLTTVAMAQNVTITGKVTGTPNGEPIPGANVVLKGTTTGTITDNEGNYSLEAPANGTLVVSFVGYHSEEVSIAGRSVIHVALT
ncbi:MAG TPA: carboxypeptidase-like regulatory domain-containing protein, partial [Prolixibacteraceae bacterium]|nr:carboxypeptidase-like regulatory domain-containing protein [Prolixibacteraceae bacterium]